MKLLISCLLVFVSVSARAQLAIVNDPDGFVNVRTDKSIKSKIAGKLYDGQLFLFADEQPAKNWVYVAFDSKNEVESPDAAEPKLAKTAKYLSGYVYRKNATPLSLLPHVRLNKSNYRISKNRLSIKSDSIYLSVTTIPFNAKKHKILHSNDGCSNCNKLFVDKVDGKKPWGVDGDLPAVEISNIILIVNNNPVNIPMAAFSDIYQPRIKNLNLYFDKKGNIYLYMPGNSDGAGGYDVAWVINNGKFVGRYVDSID